MPTSKLGPSARTHIPLSTLPRIGRVDERYQSYNVEMAEVIGGSFWRSYATQGAAPRPAVPASAANGAALQVGQDPAIFEARPPIDLANTRLRKLAAALGPAHVRVSGTRANTVYFAEDEQATATVPPAGFQGVLTGQQWAGMVACSRAVDARLVTSFAIRQGVRDAGGAWTADQARRLVAYTRSLGGEIAAAELFNEPTAAAMGGPAGLRRRGLRARLCQFPRLRALDTFRYLDQLGRLARLGVKVVFHNTLAASEYGLIDHDTLTPRLSYWAALLWRRLMGSSVLDAGAPRPGLHLYAHDLRGRPGGVALLAINTSRTESEVLDLPVAVERYTLSARKLEDAEVELNGRVLQLGSHHELPSISGEAVPAGRVELEPAGITFLTIADAGRRLRSA